MKKICVVAFVLAAAVAGCSKKKADTTPTNPSSDPNATETTTDGNATGGSTYGATPANPCAGGTTDPCAGQ